MKKIVNALSVFLLTVILFIPAVHAEALVAGDVLDDGIVADADAPYCGCCHDHTHEGKEQWFVCFFCRIVHLYNRMTGFYEKNTVHKYVLVETVAPTCITEGMQIFECLICGKNTSTVLDKKEHSAVVLAAVEASCTENGLTQGSQCADCKEILIAQTVIPVKGHSYELTEQIDPSCTTDGTQYYSCSVCGDSYEESIEAPGHDYKETVLTPVTCIADGERQFTCSRCSDSYTVTDMALGHFIPPDASVVCFAYDDPEYAGQMNISYTCYSCSASVEHVITDKKAFIRNNNSIVFYSNTAEALANSKSGDTVVVGIDDVLSESAIVPAGVMLLIPCNPQMSGYESNGYCPDNPTPTGDAVKFRTLTVEDGAVLTVNGTFLINAVTGRTGSASYLPYGNTGYYGMIDLAGDIVVENGGVLDCSGYVADNGGNVTVKNGATMYETYAIAKWRGGSYVVSHFALDMGLMPVYEWTMNNMQATLRVESGAILSGTAKMYANDQYYHARYLQIAPQNSLYRLADGAYLIREIDTENDREIYSFYGNTSFVKSSMDIGGFDIGTDKANFYTFDGDMTFNFYGGEHKITKSFAFLPGAEVNVFSGATLTFSGFAGFAMFDQGFYDIDGQVLEATHHYTTGRPNAVLHLYDGAVINANGNKSELMGDVIVEEGALINTNEKTVTETDFVIPNGWHVNGRTEKYNLTLNIK